MCLLDGKWIRNDIKWKRIIYENCNLIIILCVYIRVEIVLIFYFKFLRKYEVIGKVIVFVKKNLIICVLSVFIYYVLFNIICLELLLFSVY